MRISHNLVIDYFRKNNRMPKFDNSDLHLKIANIARSLEKFAKKQFKKELTEVSDLLKQASKYAIQRPTG